MSTELLVITTWEAAGPYLDNLRETVQDDIKPLLKTTGFAPFAICREVMSYVDHLGHLYSGKVAVGNRFCGYLKDVMSKIDPNYEKRSGEIYRMYRCGPVHEFKPKVLKNSSAQLLKWLCYNGERNDSIETHGKVTHLDPINTSGDHKTFHLPVSTKCLIADLCDSIDRFKKDPQDNKRVTAWNRAVHRLNYPYPYQFQTI